MKRILVPLDGSELAEEALGPALRLAKRHGASVRLVSIVSDVAPPVALAPDAVEAVSHWLDEEEKATHRYVDGVQARLEGRGVEISTLVEVGRVTPTLLAAAAGFGADLVMLTTHGRGAWNRLWLGSIADQLLRSSSVPLLLLRGRSDASNLFLSEDSPRHVVVPLDGSKASESVLPTVREVMPASGGRFTLVAVAQPPVLPLSLDLPDATWGPGIMAENRKRLAAQLDRVAAGLRSTGATRVDSTVADGVNVARTLISTIEGAGADLIALATQGHGAVGRLLVGSVADKLVRASDLPVLVTRRPEAE
jgi:nucleotide-binding universal stress UspA family protein